MRQRTRLAVFATLLWITSCSLLSPLDTGDFTRPAAVDAGASEGASPVDGAQGGSEDSPSLDAAGDQAAPTSRYEKEVLADAPLLYLRLADTGLTAVPRAGSVTGTYTVAGVSQGKPGALAGDPDTAVTFTDGAGSIKLPSIASFDGLVPFSVEIWIKAAANNGSPGFVLDHEDWSARSGWTLLAGPNDGIGFQRWLDGASNSIGAPAPVVGAWQYVVATFDGATQRLYVDNVRVDEGQGTISLPVRTSTLTVAHQGCCSGATAFKGDLDELAIYDKPLTETRIAAHFAAAK